MDHGKLGSQHAPPGSWAMGTPVCPHGTAAVNRPADAWVPVVFVTAPLAGPPAGQYPHHAATAYPAPTAYKPGGPYVDVSSFPYGRNGPKASNGNPPHVNGCPFPYDGDQAIGNPYVSISPVHSKSTADTMLMALDRLGRKMEGKSRKAAAVAGNVWNHLRTGPNITDAALSRLSQGTKVLAEGGNVKIFQQTFGLLPGEQLQKAYACYFSISTGPLIGMLYLSTKRIAFCSDQPFRYDHSSTQQEGAYYKVIVPLDQLKAVNPSVSAINPSEKCIQIITKDNNEFWFMGFISYDNALKHLKEALHFTPSATHQGYY